MVKKLKIVITNYYTLLRIQLMTNLDRSECMFYQEDSLIPFSTSALPGGPWLIFAPHADDETFGMGGTLLKAREQGIETHLVVLTDGSKGGDSHDLVNVRLREVKRAAELIGFKSIECWSEPDRFLDISPRLIEKACSKIRQLVPQTVFFPGPLEIHPDHRAAATLIWSALQKVKTENVHAIPISYEIGVQNPINLLIDTTDQCVGKQEIMDIYRSQNKENNYPELVLSLDKGRTFSLPPEVKSAEGFFVYKTSDLERTFREVTLSVVGLYLEM